MSRTAPRVAEPGRLARWQHALSTVNPPSGELDQVSRWLVITRAGVLPMTLTAGGVAGLLAVRRPGFAFGWFLLAFIGIVLAHVSNNLLNDLFDTDEGLDTGDYPRALYAPHPILSGMIDREGLVRAAIAVNVADLVILAILIGARGGLVLVFALAGLVLNVAYTAPPLRLKKRGLGELDVFLVWGPLMIAGTYYSAVGHLPWQVWFASIPYGLLCTAVLMGKHIDKLPWDEAAGVNTLPVLLGETRARALTKWLMVGFYVVIVVFVIASILPWTCLAVLGAIPLLARAQRALGRPRPAQPPRGFPVWPLWFAAFVFTHTRRAGALLVAGLVVAAIFGVGPGYLG
jgi:1,4-dihydroxy-2-naphthoate octaprenyltransferase